MAMDLNRIAEWFASLAIFTGGKNVTIRDLTGIPETVEPQDCPLLVPDAEMYCTDLEFERLSFRTSAGRRYRLGYTLHYVLYSSPVADGISLFATFSDLAQAFEDTITVLIDSEAIDGAHDIRPMSAPAFGPVVDPTGQLFHGCKFDLRVTEFR
jgi:hypothetical protein